MAGLLILQLFAIRRRRTESVPAILSFCDPSAVIPLASDPSRFVRRAPSLPDERGRSISIRPLSDSNVS